MSKRYALPSSWLAAAFAGVALLALLATLAPSLTGAQASAHRSLPSPIHHVVVIDLENHTFDNALGFWCNAHPGRCPDGGMPASVRLAGGTVVKPGVTPDVVPVVDHQTSDQVKAIDGGKMDGWGRIGGCTAAQGYACISGYRPSQIVNLAALATRFAISDRTFSMQNSASWFGHLYPVAASTDGFTGNNPWPPRGAPHGMGWGCDAGKLATWVSGGTTTVVPSCIPDPALTGRSGARLPNGGAFRPTPVPYVPTIMNRLNAAHLTWRIYGAQCTSEQVNPAGLNTCTATSPNGLGYSWSICPAFAECLYTQSSRLVPNSQFFTDAARRLPAFSVVTTGNYGISQHNGVSMTKGDNWIGQLVTAVMNGPDWRDTAIFITYDDCGCFYDQVRPGTNPDGTPQGPRLPLVIVSPYARPGYTDTTPTTFAGILGYTEHTFGLTPLGVNDRQAYPFTNAFNYSQTPLKPVRMVTRPLPASARHIHLTPALRNDPT